MHFKSIILGLVGSDYGNNFIFFKKAFGKLKSKKVRASPDLIRFGYSMIKKTIFMVNRICPDKITKESRLGNLFESIDILNIVQLRLDINYCLQLWRYASMNTQELTVNNAGKRKTIKHAHNRLINFLVVLAET